MQYNMILNSLSFIDAVSFNVSNLSTYFSFLWHFFSTNICQNIYILQCMAENGCFPEVPPDGLCLASIRWKFAKGDSG